MTLHEIQPKFPIIFLTVCDALFCGSLVCKNQGKVRRLTRIQYPTDIIFTERKIFVLTQILHFIQREGPGYDLNV
jgi:hypothetical protein